MCPKKCFLGTLFVASVSSNILPFLLFPFFFFAFFLTKPQKESWRWLFEEGTGFLAVLCFPQLACPAAPPPPRNCMIRFIRACFCPRTQDCSFQVVHWHKTRGPPQVPSPVHCDGCGGLGGENPGAFPKARPIFQKPLSLPESAQTLAILCLFLLDLRACNHGLKGPQKPKTYFDYSSSAILSFTPILIVRLGPVWQQDLAILSSDGPRDRTGQLRAEIAYCAAQ